jgi:hypothetical protein
MLPLGVIDPCSSFDDGLTVPFYHGDDSQYEWVTTVTGGSNGFPSNAIMGVTQILTLSSDNRYEKAR